MNLKLTLIVALIFSSPVFAQLTKATIEANFPLLTLPYELTTKDVPTMSAKEKGWIDYEKHPYIKGNVNTIINKAVFNESLKRMDDKFRKKMIDSEFSKIHAIGRIETPTQTFLVYNLNLYLEKQTSYDVIYVASLDKNYNVVDIDYILKYIVKGNTRETNAQTVIIKKAYLNKNNELTLKETFHFVETFDATGVKKADKEISRYGSVFMKDGKVMSALMF